jgi:sarcosine oxidase subunit beta
MLPKTADIVVIGGGVVGASVAYHLAEGGVKNVLLLEREKFLGMGSTGRATGGVRYQFSTAVNIRLSLYSVPIIEHFEEHFGVSADYLPNGYLFLLTRPGEVRDFRSNLELQHSLGAVWTRWVDLDEIHRLAPLITLDGILGGTFSPRDGFADPNTINQVYANEARKRGARIETETRVTGIEREGDRIRAVLTTQGRVETNTVVNCCGPWSAEIGMMAGVAIPIVPLRRQATITTPVPEFPPASPLIIDFTSSLHFRPSEGCIHIGMSNQEEKPGAPLVVDEEFKEKMLGLALLRLPLLEHATLAHDVVGYYEDTPDHHPILGAVREVKGLYVAAGFSGHGIMHSPATDKVMSEIILDGKAHTVDVSMLDLDRFREGRPIREINVV